MAAIWEKVNRVTGNDSNSTDLTPYLNMGAKWLVNSLPEKFLWSIASETTVKGWESDAGDSDTINEGSGIAYDKILAVYRHSGTLNSNPKRMICKEVPDNMSYAMDDANSIYHPTKVFPKYYKLSGKVYIKPVPDFNDRTTTNSPPALTYTKPGASSPTSVASQAGDKGVIVYAAPPVFDENTSDASGHVLIEWENILVMYAGAMDFMRLSSSYRASAATALSNANTAVGTFRTKIGATLVTFYDGSKDISGATITVPSKTLTFVPPTLSTSTITSAFTLNESLPSSIVVGQTLPTFSISEALDSEISITSALPDFVPPSFTLNFDDSSASQSFDDAMEKAMQVIDTGGSTGGGLSADYDAESLIAAEDPELVSAVIQTAQSELSRASNALQKQRTLIEEHQANVQTEGQRVSNALGKYQAELAKENARVQADATQYNAEVQKELGRFNGQVQKFSAELQKESQRAGEDTRKFQAEVDKESRRVQSEASKVQTEIAEFQANLQKAQADFQKDVAQYQNDISAFQSKVSTNSEKFKNDLMFCATYMQEADGYLKVSSDYSKKSGEALQRSVSLYQWATSELSAATGGQSSAPQQQAAQRGEEGASS
jgi:predicted  nucleic acid-binding Zn-ribbon protein|tara:strand:- start:2088 stop:3902 length:1815 start_codon:yes stop_codon:yes gene_type:complete